MIKFSLVMCVYQKENPLFLAQCLDSIRIQSVLPDELVIVKDGLLTKELEAVLQNLQFPNRVKVVALPKNLTQGPARAEGIRAASNEWVAIMDSDDICRRDRFERQLKQIESNPEVGLLGGQIAEFDDNPDIIIAERRVPTEHKNIYKFAKKRNPFNSVTVMFKRELAIRAGNYRYFPWFEDYDLWIRMIMNGVVCANCTEILVCVRVGCGMYARRRGITYIKSEWRMQRQLRKAGFINGLEFIRNVAFRIPVRLLPEKILAVVYNRFARDMRHSEEME